MILKKKSQPKPSVVFDTYWKFATERQNIFFNRIAKQEVLTDDPIFLRHKFTNVYRASDRVSQYLIKDIIYQKENYSRQDILFRIILFKIFNKISTWQLLEEEIGNICVETFNFNEYCTILSEARKAKEAIYSGAYIMTSGKSIFGYDFKHENHLKLIEQYILKPRFLESIQNCKTLESLYSLLRDLPTIGNFLAYQYAIDINYSELTNFSEMDFVMPGPGAKDGIKKCFTSYGDYSEADIIRWVTDNQEREFKRLDLDFKSLGLRPLQLIDCQNLFCETDKYARVAHPDIIGYSDRKRIKQVYKSSKNEIEYFYPPKWKLKLP
ncbi:nucleotide kinase domain-containing protein [Pedobacter riviphilus]|uniref:nucleotide kinase domain-containing protein n=1 Tax=Pedobacter riviphilus TaxID=2766984 RepID=UPI001CC25EC6|nr:nucleotide kinase domain-containing protein [Pedobacter riviphilus]